MPRYPPPSRRCRSRVVLVPCNCVGEGLPSSAHEGRSAVMGHFRAFRTLSLFLLVLLANILDVADLSCYVFGKEGVGCKGSSKVRQLYESTFCNKKVGRLCDRMRTFRSRCTTPSECSFYMIRTIFAAIFLMRAQSRSLSV